VEGDGCDELDERELHSPLLDRMNGVAILPGATALTIQVRERAPNAQETPSRRLVVEVDGASHLGRTTADARRDRVLRRLGLRVLRLPANLVMCEPLVAIERIRAAIANG
jgi:hypothetical protein